MNTQRIVRDQRRYGFYTATVISVELIFAAASIYYLIYDLRIFTILLVSGISILAMHLLRHRTGRPCTYRFLCGFLSIQLLLLLYIQQGYLLNFLFVMLFPVVFFVLLGLTEGLIWSSVFAVPVVLIFVIRYLHVLPRQYDNHLMNAGLLIAAYATIVYSIYREASTYEIINRELQISNDQLSQAMNEIRVLKGILPVCSHCKRIRTEEGQFIDPDEYISSHTDSQITHSLCPDCIRELYPEMADEILGDNR
ncbi:MAG: hypothetical protein K9M84_13445 [Spirochaetia bacterium]|nr:hypothetical protein [Spirochaetia bacterium]